MDKLFHFLKNSFFSGLICCSLIGLAPFQFTSFSTLEAQTVDATFIENSTHRLHEVHSRLQLRHGNFGEEYPEQLMSAMFLDPMAKVLELGGNIGSGVAPIKQDH